MNQSLPILLHLLYSHLEEILFQMMAVPPELVQIILKRQNTLETTYFKSEFVLNPGDGIYQFSNLPLMTCTLYVFTSSSVKWV